MWVQMFSQQASTSLQLSAAVIAFSLLALVGTVSTMTDIDANEPVVVVFSPFGGVLSAFSAIANAGAPIAAAGKVDWIAMSGPLDSHKRRKLRASGALFFLSGDRAAWLCNPRSV